MTADNDNMPTDFDPRLGSGLHATYLPDWRFRRAIQFMQLGRTSTDKSVDDDLLIATAKFLREFVKADEAPYPDFAHVDLAKKMPGLYGAWFAHEYPDPGLRHDRVVHPRGYFSRGRGTNVRHVVESRGLLREDLLRCCRSA